MANLIAYCLALIVSLVVVVKTQPATLPFEIALAAAVGFSIPLIDAFLRHRRELLFAWYSLRYARSWLRISASYLYRIQVDGKYLLVKGNRFPQYQPVGGVWKVGPGGAAFLKKIGALQDDLLPIDDVSRGDLRIRIKGIHLYAFISWFASGQGREVGPWREFYEELVAPGVVPAVSFPHIDHEFVRRRYHPIRYSDYAQSRELLIADIFEVLPSKGQAAQLIELGELHQSTRWVSEDQIRRRGADPGQPMDLPIGEPAEWTL